LDAVSSELDQNTEADIAKVLEHRYGDGLVYLPKKQPESLFKIAKTEGFIDLEGYLTRKGRYLLAKYQFS
jgi:hypothetical protein